MKVKLIVTGSQGRTPYYYSGNWASDITGLNIPCKKDFHLFSKIYDLLSQSDALKTSGHHYVGDGVGSTLGIILPANFFLFQGGKMWVNEEVSKPIIEAIEQTIEQVIGLHVEVELFCPNIR
jgi:hypothetical protein